MSNASHDTGVIVALVERFEKQRLPRVLDMKKRVDQGETLTDDDIEFLDEVYADSQKILPFAERNPKWQDLTSRAIALYGEVTEKALDNERKAAK